MFWKNFGSFVQDVIYKENEHQKSKQNYLLSAQVSLTVFVLSIFCSENSESQYKCNCGMFK